MPLPKITIDKYLDRKIEPRAWVKELKPSEVEYDLSRIKPTHKFRAPLRLDQKICFLVGVAYPDTVFMTDLGLGKSVLSLELLSYFYENGFIRKAFVFAPTNEVAEGWEDEIKKWGFPIPYVRLSKTLSKDKFRQLGDFDDGIVIGTYAGIAAMAATLEPAGKQRLKRVIQNDRLARLIDGVDAVVYDQSTHLGNLESLSTQVAKEFSLKAQIRYALAGRAFGRNPYVLFSQFFLVDHGRALGLSPDLFREAFWQKDNGYFGSKWVFRKRREAILGDFIAASSIRYSVDECLELPPKILIRKECEFPAENWLYYDKLIEEIFEVHGNFREVKNTFLRMRQISSGFVGFRDDETGERAQIEFDNNPKLELLLELVEEVPADRKMVIFHEYTYSGSRICQELNKRNIPFGWLWSGTKDWTVIKEAFLYDPEFRVIVANWKKASMGLNLQSASYMFFYESPVSAIERYEAEGRIYRNGQKHKSMIYDLVIKDSVDQKILEFHQQGNDLFKALVEDPDKFFNRRRR